MNFIDSMDKDNDGWTPFPSLSLSIESMSQNETFCVIFKHCDILYKSTGVPMPDKCQLSWTIIHLSGAWQSLTYVILGLVGN